MDWVALSFVQRPEDIREARELIGDKAFLMAKIEKPSAVQRLQEIAELRLEHPEVSLKELGEMIPSGAISKSGINHRIRKINEFADHLREQVS